MPTSAESSKNMSADDQRLLNTYIHDYLVKQAYSDTARAFLKETELPTLSEVEAKKKADSGDALENTLGGALDGKHRQVAAAAAGDDDRAAKPAPDAGDTASSGSDSPGSLTVDVPIDIEGSFLAEWWTLFWDMFAARQGRPSSGTAASFMAHNQVSDDIPPPFLDGRRSKRADRVQ